MWARGRRESGGLVTALTDFCPYPRNKWNLRRAVRIKQDEEWKALGEGLVA